MRKEPRWVIAFLRALERTGEVRTAAKDAGVDFTTAYARRKAHADFASAWAAALKGHQEARARGEAEAIAAVRAARAVGRFSPDLRELRVGGGQVRRVGEGRLRKTDLMRFFATLAGTANVELAAEAAGVSANAMYGRRLRDRLFAEQWAAAVEIARARIDLGAIELANQAIAAMIAGVPGTAPKITLGEALQVLKLGAEPRVPTDGGGRRRLNAGACANVRVATNQEVIDALTKRLAAFARREKLPGPRSEKEDGAED